MSHLKLLTVADIPERKKQIRFLTGDEVHLFLSVAESTNKLIHAYSALAYYAGLRNGSIMAMKWGDIHYMPDGRYRINVPQKGGKLVALQLDERLVRILTALADMPLYGSCRSMRDKLIITYGPRRIRTLFKAVAESAGLGWVTPHVMRHTFGSHLAQAGVPIQQISQLMGHQDIKVTIDHYAALCPSVLDDAVSRLP